MCYNLGYGRRWRGDYYVLGLEEYRESSPNRSDKPVRVKMVGPPTAPVFPVKAGLLVDAETASKCPPNGGVVLAEPEPIHPTDDLLPPDDVEAHMSDLDEDDHAQPDNDDNGDAMLSEHTAEHWPDRTVR